MKLLLACVLSLMASLPAGAANFSQGSRGTNSADFLTLGPGGRATAMGEAYSAAADEASALYWNPAAITRIQKRSATVMHSAYVSDSYYDYGAVVQNLGTWGAVGFGGQFFSAGPIPRTDDAGADLGEFRPYGLALTLGYANTFHDIDYMEDFNGVSLGVAAKYVRGEIVDHDQTLAFDLGVLTPEYFERIRAAFTVTNLGRGLRFDNDYSVLPMTFRVGTVFKVLPGWIATTDVVFPRNNVLYPALGTEYSRTVSPDVTLSGRAGFNAVSIGDVQGFSGATFGLGAAFRGMSVDYGFMPLGSLGQAHRASVSFSF